MGYCSCVKMLVELPERNVEEVANELKSFGVFDEVKVNEEKHLVLASNDYIKWYTRFPEVESAMNWIDAVGSRLDDEEEPGGIHFVRFGEDLSDGEEYCYGCVNYYLDVVRQIGDGDFE